MPGYPVPGRHLDSKPAYARRLHNGSPDLRPRAPAVPDRVCPAKARVHVPDPAAQRGSRVGVERVSILRYVPPRPPLGGCVCHTHSHLIHPSIKPIPKHQGTAQTKAGWHDPRRPPQTKRGKPAELMHACTQDTAHTRCQAPAFSQTCVGRRFEDGVRAFLPRSRLTNLA